MRPSFRIFCTHSARCERHPDSHPALLTLALGIGANTVIFSVIRNVLLSPPHFKYLNRLAIVFDVNRKTAGPDLDINPSPGNFLDWGQQTRAFDQLVAWRNWYHSLAGCAR
ncbi:MAG: hypothetical protein LAQ69_31270 [Acidobacteriia bacterium]|nr:hypothetical protein [Terriglobia bacterium]